MKKKTILLALKKPNHRHAFDMHDFMVDSFNSFFGTVWKEELNEVVFGFWANAFESIVDDFIVSMIL